MRGNRYLQSPTLRAGIGPNGRLGQRSNCQASMSKRTMRSEQFCSATFVTYLKVVATIFT